mmetsp:Transcript_29142/g.53175  ORF Transcript_29142/g.53175 Transcript_29142/m.53175 type:complete len:756 (-) Transcript_29142:62-2329(-)
MSTDEGLQRRKDPLAERAQTAYASTRPGNKSATCPPRGAARPTGGPGSGRPPEARWRKQPDGTLESRVLQDRCRPASEPPESEGSMDLDDTSPAAGRRTYVAEADLPVASRTTTPTLEGDSQQRPAAGDATQSARDEWVSRTQEQVITARSLRQQLHRKKIEQLQAEFADTSLDAGDASATNNSPRRCGQVTRILEDRLKRRTKREQNIAQTLALRMECMAETSFQVGKRIEQLQRLSSNLWTAINLAQKRIDMRAQRPADEVVDDEVNEALEQEKVDVLEAHSAIGEQLEAGKQMREATELARAHMLKEKLTLHTDRTVWPEEFLGRTASLEEDASQYQRRAEAAIKDAEDVQQRALRRSVDCLKRHLEKMESLRKQLAQEAMENRFALDDAQRMVDRLDKEIKSLKANPERRLREQDGTLDTTTLGTSAAPLSEEQELLAGDIDQSTLGRVRAKIKAAAYTGKSGRQLDVLFTRMDRDRSGQLDEDEIRRMLRRVLRIPPTVISDPEISAFCVALDSDHSGTLSIKEIMDFLENDADLVALEEEHDKMRAMLKQLQEVQEKILANYRAKGAAWKIDKSALAANAIHSQELDVSPSVLMKRPNRKQRPLEPRVVERIREKLRSSVQAAGGELQELVEPYAKEGALTSQSLRQALRLSLQVPMYAISDTDVNSFSNHLKSEGTGTIAVKDLVDFVGATPETKSSSRCGSTPNSARLLPIKPGSATSETPAQKRQHCQNHGARPKTSPELTTPRKR